MSGSVRLSGTEISTWSLRRRLEARASVVPEDRKTQGVLLPLSVQCNLALPSWSRLGPGPHVSARQERNLARRLVDELHVVTRTLTQGVLTLSGGNQQKIAVGKWLVRERQLYVFDEPTRGVDVAARRALYELMVQIVERGGAILMISSDLPEVLNMSDRVYVMRTGAISATSPVRKPPSSACSRRCSPSRPRRSRRRTSTCGVDGGPWPAGRALRCVRRSRT